MKEFLLYSPTTYLFTFLETMGSREWITEPDEYICKLSEETQLIAKEELREDEYTRQSALASMREWIKQNPKIKNIRMGIR